MEPRFKIHQQTELFSQKPIHFQVTVMSKCVMIWIGRSQDGLGDLSVGMPVLGHVSFKQCQQTFFFGLGDIYA